MAESIEKFLKHDWKTDEKWKLYLSNLFPSPSLDNIEKYKKKYFQKNVDPSFDINYETKQSEVPTKNYQNTPYPNTQQSQTYNTNEHNYTNGKLTFCIFFYYIFILCISIVYFVLLMLNISYHKKFGIVLSVLYFFSFLGLLCLDYKSQKQNFSWINFFSSEKGQYLSYSILLFFIKDAFLVFLPIFLTLLMNTYMIYKKIKHYLPEQIREHPYINKMSALMDEKIIQIYLLRSNVEIYNLFFIFICLLFRRVSLLNLIIYLHFFKLKYTSTDPYFHACYSKNGEVIRQYLSHPMVPNACLQIYNKIAHYFNTYLSYNRR